MGMVLLASIGIFVSVGLAVWLTLDMFEDAGWLN
jgi:hypothetical protein